MCLQILGSGEAFGSGAGLQTCIYVKGESANFLLDCGDSSFLVNCAAAGSLSHISDDILCRLHGTDTERTEDGKRITL
jgi:hypothetical protein